MIDVTRKSFLDKIDENPHDLASWCAYADWLLDSDCEGESEYIRKAIEWRKYDASNDLPASNRQVTELANLSVQYPHSGDPFKNGRIIPMWQVTYSGKKPFKRFKSKDHLAGWAVFLTYPDSDFMLRHQGETMGCVNSEPFFGEPAHFLIVGQSSFKQHPDGTLTGYTVIRKHLPLRFGTARIPQLENQAANRHESIHEEFLGFQNGLQRFLVVSGMHVQDRRTINFNCIWPIPKMPEPRFNPVSIPLPILHSDFHRAGSIIHGTAE